MIVVVTSHPGDCGERTDAGKTLRRWLRETGIDLASVRWVHVLDAENKSPGVGLIRNGTARLMNELAELSREDKIEVVIAVGSTATKIDSELWRQDMSRRHGHSGTLWALYPAIGLYNPWFCLGQKDTRRRLETENSCKLVLSRAMHLNDAVEVPVIEVKGTVTVRGRVGFDTETTQDEALAKRIRGAGYQKNKTVEPRASQLKMVGLSTGELSFSLARFAPDAEPIAYNMPFDAIIAADALKRNGLDPNEALTARWHDPKMGAHLLGEKDTEMKSLALRWLGRPLMHYAEARDTDLEPPYCVSDTRSHAALMDEFDKRAPSGVKWLYENVERPMLRLYARWAYRGVYALDRERAEAIQAIQTHELEQLLYKLHAITGITNPSSWRQVCAAFGVESSKEAVIAPLAGTVAGVSELLKWRERNKAKSTYVDAWLNWPFPLLGTLWRGTGAWTGRPSSAALNLQNISAGCDHHEADELYRCRKCLSFNLRALLGPEDGYVLRSFDNSQLEIRIAAHISQDPNMLRLLRGEMPGYEDADMHRWTTDLISKAAGYRVPRTFGKIGNFSTLYGGSESAIVAQAARFDVEADTIRPVAKVIHKELPAMFPGFFKWKRTVENLDRVPGLFGAILVPPPHPDESYLQRERVNAPIQRGGVDVLKIQTLALEAEGYETVHQIHDEVIVKIRRQDDTPENTERIKYIMAEAVELRVPLKVDSKLWGNT